MRARQLGTRRRIWSLRGAFAVAAGLATGEPTAAADLRVVVNGLRNDAGAVLVAVCPRATFLKRNCPHIGQAPAAGGEVSVAQVPPGEYAIQAFHDENGNGDLDRRGLRPLEGMGFSRDAPLRFGPPRFGDAAVVVREPGGSLTLTMRYF